ncbi:hypothetical protein J2T56_001479 [Natronobacillus azotifigens]
MNENIIVVLSCGSEVKMPWVNQTKGLLHGYLSGQAGAKAMLKIITGLVNPSGKLAESYPIKYEDTPTYHYFPGKEVSVEYREAQFIGYRYYDTNNIPVRYPFGYGLSYTSFSYDIKVAHNRVEFTLTNTGKQAGKEIAQLYIGSVSNQIFRAKKELKGFSKVFLMPGESKRVSILFNEQTFRYYNVKTSQWEIEENNYQIMIGSSSEEIRLSAELFVKGTTSIMPYEPTKLSPYYNGDITNIADQVFEKLIERKLPQANWNRTQPLDYNDTIAQCQYAKGLFARFIFHALRFVHKFLWKIGKQSTANLIMMSVYHMPFRGYARMTGGAINMPMVGGILMIVNGHFFKGLAHIFKETRKMKKLKKQKKIVSLMNQL